MSAQGAQVYGKAATNKADDMDEDLRNLLCWRDVLFDGGINERKLALAIIVAGTSLNRVLRHRRWGPRSVVQPSLLHHLMGHYSLDNDGALALLEALSSRLR